MGVEFQRVVDRTNHVVSAWEDKRIAEETFKQLDDGPRIEPPIRPAEHQEYIFVEQAE